MSVNNVCKFFWMSGVFLGLLVIALPVSFALIVSPTSVTFTYYDTDDLALTQKQLSNQSQRLFVSNDVLWASNCQGITFNTTHIVFVSEDFFLTAHNCMLTLYEKQKPTGISVDIHVINRERAPIASSYVANQSQHIPPPVASIEEKNNSTFFSQIRIPPGLQKYIRVDMFLLLGIVCIVLGLISAHTEFIASAKKNLSIKWSLFCNWLRNLFGIK
jgi:hypothetical protein